MCLICFFFLKKKFVLKFQFLHFSVQSLPVHIYTITHTCTNNCDSRCAHLKDNASIIQHITEAMKLHIMTQKKYQRWENVCTYSDALWNFWKLA